MAGIKRTNRLFRKHLLLLLLVLVLVLPKVTCEDGKYRWNTTDNERTCYKGAPAIPKIYYVNGTTIKCIFHQPIRWIHKSNKEFHKMASNSRIESYEVIPSSQPYKVKLDWKSCNSVNQTARNISKVKIYFESVLVWRNIPSNVNTIVVGCMSISNSARSDAKWITETNKLRNLNKPTEGKERFPKTSNSSCQNVSLASNSQRSKYGCVVKNTAVQLHSSAAQYLECPDWINCQQLAGQVFKGICTGDWSPTYCDLNPTMSHCISQKPAFNSGIIYCGKGTQQDHAFYMLFFKVQFNNISRIIDLISEDDVESNGKALVFLTNSTTVSESGQQCILDIPLSFTCSAPKFLALERFQWTAIYVGGSSIDVSEACNTTRGNANDTYIERLICESPIEHALKEIHVTCTVRLQSGVAVMKNATMICTRDNITGTSNSTGTNNSSGSSSAKSPDASLRIDPDQFEHALFAIGGGVGCLLLTLPILIFYYCKVQRQKKQLNLSPEEVEQFMKGNAVQNSRDGNDQTPTVLPYDVSLEVPRSQLLIESKILGQGAFGKVMKGKIGNRDVAIKTINKNVDGQYFRALLSELKIMTFVGKHPNVVELVGANTERISKQEVYLIFEFCENGNILEYIRSKRDLFVTQYSGDVPEHNITSTVEYVNGVSNRFCSEDLVRWSLEIASGMELISSKNVYHGDLAARNILMTRNLVAKVGDFGLAKDLKNYSLYVQKLGCPLPLKWMSIESLRDLEFSIQSDVWSFGITLWEIFSLGSTPYPGVEWNFQAWKRLQDGERMDRPLHATDSIYHIMMKCWETKSQDRPSFAQLKRMLKCELEEVHTISR